MRSTHPLLLSLALLVVGCASAPTESDSAAAPETASSGAQAEPAPAGEQATAATGDPATTAPGSQAASQPIGDLAALEGHWSRDDGRRYVWVHDPEQGCLLGYDEDDDPWGSRVRLDVTGEGLGLGGTLTHSVADEATRLTTEWQLRRTGAERLEGEVQYHDLGEQDDRVVDTDWTTHRFVREAPLEAGSRDGWLALARFHAALDLVADDFQALQALLMSPELQALEHVPHNESVVARVQPVVKRMLRAQAKGAFDSLAASAEKPAPPESPAASAGGAPDMDGFLARFDGTSAGVEAALDAYGAPGLERSEMDWYDLVNPRVVGEDVRDGLTWYRLEADAGITVRAYELGWDGGRIAQVVFIEMR